ncbi:nucleotidyltransferase domain-containing protein [Lysobacter sp. LF1]|uniref:Nucleotidyltransferase domain-containing protein n=1 Tax=Lysobacter stagni TaxID=3045172 RepID=A0ABT6XB83_9GAMM|nr:nucleotidyltransferase domain-containing protein [Lysobacter sp. LF1]MDI9237402.1 nucleotidyltransferase domain-containing protein [Lysobacter sp. LF1]
MSGIPALHSHFLERIRDAVAADVRFSALLAGGSYVHGGFDAYSDLDVVIVVDDAHYDEAMASRMAFARSLGDLLGAFTGEHVGEPRLLICLYGPPLLHVDLKFVTATDLDRRVERPAILYARDRAAVEARLDAAHIHWPERSSQWFEDRAWIWLHYAAAKWGRGELFDALGMLAFFRDQVLGPMLHRRASRPQRGVRRAEALGMDDDGRLSATVASHDTASVRGAILAAAALYLDLRADAVPERITPRMPQVLIDYIDGSGRR